MSILHSSEGVGGVAEPGKETSTKGGKKSVWWQFQNKLPSCRRGSSPFDLQELHIRKGQKILQGMLIILIAQGFPMQSTTT